VGIVVDNPGESVQVAGGTAGQPNPEVSPEQEVQPTSLEADDKLETADERLTRLEALVRSIQGDKDRGTNKALETVNLLDKRIAEMEVYSKMRMDGKSKEEAQRELVLEEIVRERMGAQVTQEGVGSSTVEPSVFDADGFLQGQGLDPNDAGVLDLIREGKTSETDYLRFALEKKSKPVAEPNAAQLMAGGTGTLVSEPKEEELVARLLVLQQEPSKHLKERTKIMEELKKFR